ncbi:transposase family protein [Legionella santicrucis]
MDPRVINHNVRHEMKDILIISLLAVICGADSWGRYRTIWKL